MSQNSEPHYSPTGYKIDNPLQGAMLTMFGLPISDPRHILEPNKAPATSTQSPAPQKMMTDPLGLQVPALFPSILGAKPTAAPAASAPTPATSGPDFDSLVDSVLGSPSQPTTQAGNAAAGQKQQQQQNSDTDRTSSGKESIF
jgi:hypothetical protein